MTPSTATARAHPLRARLASRYAWHALAAGVFLAGALPTLALGGIAEDESFYAHAAWLVGKGLSPYADFMFPQAPLAAYAYALPLHAGGVVAARAVSLLAGLATIFVTMRVARREAGERAGRIAGLVVATSLPFLVLSGAISPLPLAALFVALALAALASDLPRPLAFALAAAALALGAATRLNVAFGLPMLALYALRERDALRCALAAVVAGGAVLAAAFAPLVLADVGSARWSLVTYQSLDARDPAHGLVALAKYKADGLGLMASAFPAVALLAPFAAWTLWRRDARSRGLASFAAALAVAIVVVTFAKTYVQPHYVAPVLPALALVVGVALSRAWPERADARRAATTALAIVLAYGLLVHAPAHIAAHAPASDPAVLASAASLVRDATVPGDEILTFLPMVAILADRAVTPGSEMGRFAYFPAMGDEDARAARVLNARLALDALETRAPAAVVLREGDLSFTPFPTARLDAHEEARTRAAFDAALAAGYREAGAWGDVRVFVRH